MPSIVCGALEVDYLDMGPPTGLAVLLLHGWPDDRDSWLPVADALVAGGLRCIVPSLRGFGATRFVSAETPCTGNAAMLALDAIALLDSLGVDRFHVAGHDWGASIAEALAVGWPWRVARLAMLGSPPRLGGMPTPTFEQAQRQWYHWFMATRRGEQAIRKDPRGFAHIHWVNWSPPGWFDEATFERTAQAFDNPDWIDVTLHSYRARWDEAEPDPASLWLDEQVKATRTLSVPAVYFQGEVDGVNPPSQTVAVADKFTGPFERVVLPGVGHFIQREAPAEVAARLLVHFGGGRPG
ncbi:alpha/beta hydrolase [Xylophilus sp. GOD-11R]|uniref:alpha/beta fold hydrolase n=1 Tax=Xylophilus sp. GOD-11R TaxID=3089814 RepID=UPI00298D08F7|nr:alpha/beta hydrolase [Xylophilus sp. GOD-11R]WPB58411.1 alpha/beta hydrolase [Xylophilus sp. GOD-11R]